MSYDPPKKDYEKEAYDIGYNDSKNGRKYRADGLYPPSGHERCTSYIDELNFQYYVGFYDFGDE